MKYDSWGKFMKWGRCLCNIKFLKIKETNLIYGYIRRRIPKRKKNNSLQQFTFLLLIKFMITKHEIGVQH